jgi:hypothetical protein
LQLRQINLRGISDNRSPNWQAYNNITLIQPIGFI